MHILEPHGYSKDPNTGVWVRSDFQGIAYSDGDTAETELARIIHEAGDVSVLSDELPQFCTDWAKLYHLSATRSNILRPFEHLLKGRVLEIGAGCGALSRYLGECGADLLCLEGSPRRAAIAASRTRGLDNVTVLAERFDDFSLDVQFDAITLIGVLEYASMFSNAENPALAMLKRVRQLLKPDGHLFIAIENQLGLKYFAGAPEDHVGIAMYGIEGRYEHGQPKTFGKVELERLIASAGFASSAFMAPCPDYKLPNSIITEAGFNCQDFDAAALAWQNVKKDPQLPESTAFNLEKAWQVVFNNRLGMDLANSFLVVARCSQDETPDGTVLAYHYSVGRKTLYCKESLFVRNADGIQVEYKKLNGSTLSTDEHDDAGVFNYVLPRIDAYASGKILSREFLDSAARHDWSIDSFAPFVTKYLGYLQALLEDAGTPVDLQSAKSMLPGQFIDAVPQNIVIQADRTPRLIDVEWEMAGGVELGHLMMRALLLLMAAANPFYPSRATFSRQEFTIGLLARAGLHIEPDDCERYIATEAAFQEKVTGKRADHFLDWAPQAPIHKLGSLSRPLKYATLYISDENGAFSESRAVFQEVGNGTQTIRFSLPERLPLSTLLRFDPVNQCQAFSIHRITVYADAGVYWEWPGDPTQPLAVTGALRIARATDALHLALNTDPSVRIPLIFEPSRSSDGLELEIHLTLFTDEQLTQEIDMINQTEFAKPGSDLQCTFDLIVDSTRDIVQALEQVKSLLGYGDSAAVLPSSHSEQLEAPASSEPPPVQQALTEDLEQALIDKEACVAELRERLRVQQVEKDTHIHNLNLHIIAMQSSTSWKVTAPARHAAILARRAKKVARLLPSIIRRGGGLTSTVRKAVKIWRQHGTAGVISRLRWFAGAGNFEFVGQETREVVDRHDYSVWVKYYDTLDDHSRWKIREEIRNWHERPLISIVMPVYNPPLDLLREAVDSVKAQLYTHWELCIADDASSDPQVRAYLAALEQQERRVKVVYRKENGHISHASNSALELATGEFVALMDNDDLLSEHALYWVVRAIRENPDAGLIYSDEDKIDTSGNRSAPYFKSDWNEFLFRSQNMVCHLGVYKLALVRTLGGFRAGFEGAQDYDLALRCSERLQREQIVHIPRVLYHWRIHAGSTAMAGGEKPYAALAGVKALDEHLQRKGDLGSTELLPMGMYRVHYSPPATQPLVSLIIPTRNAYGLVKQCIDSIERLTTYKHYEIILIDNGSDDPVALDYFARLDQQDNIHVLRDDGPFNYSALNNKAVQLARGELIGLINNDIEVITPEWLDEMVSLAMQPNVGAVGARLWYPDDRLQHGGVVIGVGGVAGHSHKYLPKGDYGYFCRAALIQEFSAVTAACLIIRKSIFEQVEGLDEEHLKIAFNDVDFCLRVQEAGYLNVWTPFAELYHHESATRGLEDTPEKKERFSKEVQYIKSRWPKIQEDYTYNPNLTLDHEDFGLAWPPRVKI